MKTKNRVIKRRLFDCIRQKEIINVRDLTETVQFPEAKCEEFGLTQPDVFKVVNMFFDYENLQAQYDNFLRLNEDYISLESIMDKIKHYSVVMPETFNEQFRDVKLPITFETFKTMTFKDEREAQGEAAYSAAAAAAEAGVQAGVEGDPETETEAEATGRRAAVAKKAKKAKAADAAASAH